MEELIAGLTQSIGYIKTTDYIWVGVMECKTARKYKFEVYWFYGAENYDYEDEIEDQINHADTRMCKTLKEAYAHGFDAIRKTLQDDSTVTISITDLVAKDEEE